jgi:ATP-dependent exoDNAse (exonuclease V) beta subunit
VATVLEDFVNRTDYRAALLSSGNARSARNVTKLLVDAHNSGIVGIGEFLTFVKGLRLGPAREGEAPATVGDVVRIMTIHAAKGLEFPVVIIGDINYQRKSTEDLLMDPDLGVFPTLTDDDGAGSAMFRLLQKTELDQEDAESDRLLYVAATRAKEKLLLSGSFKLTKYNRPGWLKGWLKKLSAPLDFGNQEIAYDEEGQQARQLSLKIGDSDIGCRIYEPDYDTLRHAQILAADSFDAGVWSSSLLQDLTADSRQPDRRPERTERVWHVSTGGPQPQAQGRLVGTLVHEALAIWRFPGPGFDQWIEARARNHGLTGDDQITDAISRVETLLNRFQAHDLYAIMESADRHLTEVPYDRVGAIGQPLHGIIDALYLKDGTWTLVDYKTDELKDEAQYDHALEGEEGVEGYDNQVDRYASAVKKFTGKRPRTILCFLEYRGKIRLRPEPDWL